ALLASLAQRAEVSLRIERLPLGDYLIDNRLLIERKTLPDLVRSITDGRLFSQACRLAESPLLTAMLLEGTARDLEHTQMRREAIQGALITVALYLGIPILRSRDAKESAALLLYAARQGRAVAQGVLPRRGRRTKGKRAIQSRILQGLPLVGPERAKRPLNHFGSVEQVLAADGDKLKAIDGIGDTVAETIRWAVRDQGGRYGIE
ncbi:MAG: ERCC4 domain-containing protein, partial [Gammaproteobacteria bacterium]